jgi:CheY-like chemotaxis protein
MEVLTEAENMISATDVNSSARFIVIDDDPLNNTICRLTIKKALGVAEVKTFTDPVQGLEYIDQEYSTPETQASYTVLFLDINMPIMNGWEFLEKYETLSNTVKGAIKVYILSSSVDDRDIEKAQANKNIVNYLAKPITKEKVIEVSAVS